jgi:hypothetical protein
MSPKNNKPLNLSPNQSGKKNSLPPVKNNRAGFYAKVLDEAEALDFETAAGAEGLDDEITLLRVRIKSLWENDPQNVAMLLAATRMLAVLVKIRYSITPEQKASLAESIKSIIKDIGVPLGVSILNKKL